MTLESVPQLPYEAKRYLSRTLGFLVREKIDLDRYVDKSPAAAVPGLLVMGSDGPAAGSGLREGDLITTVNDTPVSHGSRAEGRRGRCDRKEPSLWSWSFDGAT